MWNHGSIMAEPLNEGTYVVIRGHGEQMLLILEKMEIHDKGSCRVHWQRELKVAIVGNLGITAVTENCLRCWSDGCGDATTQYSQVMGSGAGPFNVFATKVKFGLLLLFSVTF
ncbi:hypothetical protein KSS87_002645 [Heliosperma pusillum]|nr:hypothetical protein KSS87_002645 [Heliosperma pusillum]